MKAIFVRQPFAYLLVAGCMDVVCHAWPTTYRGPLLVLSTEQEAAPADIRYAEEIAKLRGCALPPIYDRATYDLGGIVGIAHLVDCVTSSQSVWHTPGTYGYVFTQARTIPFLPYPDAKQAFKMDSVDYLWDDSPLLAHACHPLRRPVRKPSREWFETFQQRVDRSLAARHI